MGPAYIRDDIFDLQTFYISMTNYAFSSPTTLKG